MVSQSGGLATMAQAFAQKRGMGFNLTVSTGNEAMLDVADDIYMPSPDDETKVIAAYIEGVRDGPRFIEAVSAARRGRKAGRGVEGRAFQGRRAGRGRTYRRACRRRARLGGEGGELGIITVGSAEQLLDVRFYLSRLDLTSLCPGHRVAVISFGGGSGVSGRRSMRGAWP